jgi:2-methylcitrate dehydratase PrpD
MAAIITGAKYEDVPAPAINLAKLCLLDAVGCAVCGTTRPLGRIVASLVDELGGKPVARVVGTGIENNAVNAALANGTLGHSEDFDDYGAGHQTVTLMPVVLGLGEELRASGRQALLAALRSPRRSSRKRALRRIQTSWSTASATRPCTART